MNLEVLNNYIKHVLEDEDGYFYTIISDQSEKFRYEIMIKNKVFKIRLQKPDEIWDEFKIVDNASTNLVLKNISIQQMLVEIEQAIINKGLFNYMRYIEVEELVGKKIMQEGSEHMATFAKIFKKTVNKEVRKAYGKFELIKQEE